MWNQEEMYRISKKDRMKRRREMDDKLGYLSARKGNELNQHLRTDLRISLISQSVHRRHGSATDCVLVTSLLQGDT